MAFSHTKHPQNLTAPAQEEVRGKCVYAKQYEERQEFLKACRILAPWWKGIGVAPHTDGLDLPSVAELYLRTGALTGWRGSAEKIEGSQEWAKDLISTASGYFRELADNYKIAECDIELSICYFREGSIKEALVLLDEAEGLIDEGCLELRLRILYNKAMLIKEEGRLEEAIEIHKSAALLYEICSYKTLQCKYHDQYALTLRRLWERENNDDYVDEIITNYTASSVISEQVGNQRQAAFVENNLGFFLMKLERYSEAEIHLNEAAQRFIRIKDKSCEAQVKDTLADLSLAQGRNDEAERYASESVATLRSAGEFGLLAQALVTHGKALARGRHNVKAVETLREAASIGVQYEDYKIAGLALATLLEEVPGLTYEQKSAICDEAAGLLKNIQDPIISGKIIDVLDLNQMAKGNKQQSDKSLEPIAEVWNNLTLEEAKLKLEEWMIRTAIERNGGNVSKAARDLGQTPQNIHDRINKVHTHLKDWKRTVHTTDTQKGRHVTGDSKVRSIEYYKRIKAKGQKSSTKILRVDSEAFSDRDIKRGDIVVINSIVDVEENCLAVVRYLSKNYMGYYRRQGYKVILETRTPGFSSWEFRYDEIDIVGCVVGLIKSKDRNDPNANIYPIE
ncbi:MAG TPA: tetratricopeptide repeat protein [Pyrinomonadaceae bacterium]|jgi:tetratricopeptide (TPR) repeat protein